MDSFKSKIEKRIQKTFSIVHKEPKERKNLKLTSLIDFNIQGETAIIKLDSNAVCENMQENKAAFEAWALIIKRWGKYKNVKLSWEKPECVDDLNYQRFLFRAKNFENNFSWFTIENRCNDLINDLKIKELGKYTLNLPSKERGIGSPTQKEAVLENRFVHGEWKKQLMHYVKANKLFNQLPVGVYEGKRPIFTKQKSAIDIWGYNKTGELMIFELKAPGNTKIGIISELYFYVCVLKMVQYNKFMHNCTDENILNIRNTSKIKAYLLSPKLHTLIDKEILALLNTAHPDVNYEYIEYKHIECEPNSLSFHSFDSYNENLQLTNTPAI